MSIVTSTKLGKKEGDISSVFVSLSGDGEAPQLPARFADIKKALVAGKEGAVEASWSRLLKRLQEEREVVKARGSDIIPHIEYADLDTISSSDWENVKQRGCAVIHGVIPEQEAKAYKTRVQEYLKQNPETKAFPRHDPQVFELYWSAPQLMARSHPNLLKTQKKLMELWNSKDAQAPISLTQPLAYADRLRIRKPGDAGFALGPHVDGGSVERWEPEGYGPGGVYSNIWNGWWEGYDPWEASSRVPVDSDRYQGGGACSMFRMFQGWLSMSNTKPGEGTLMVNPMLQLSTAYFLLRPFFQPLQKSQKSSSGPHDEDFLRPENWQLQPLDAMNADLQGANPGHAQELNDMLHPHLDLQNTMVHIPEVRPGDFVVWHCDSIHAVDKVHKGELDSSVMYIPVCPTTAGNATYMARQRDTFLSGAPPPDFPGGKGESDHKGRPTESWARQNINGNALQAMGLAKLSTMDRQETVGARQAVQLANEALGY